MVTAPRVAVVGGGTAGAHVIAGLLHEGFSLTLIEPTGHHQFLTRLAAVAGGTAPVSDAAVPLTDLFDVRVISEPMVSFDDGSVSLADGSTVDAEIIVVAAGAQPTAPPIEGIEVANSLRSAGDAIRIRQSLEHSRGLAVVGGGPTGVQLAGAVSVAHPDVEVTVIEAQQRLLPAFGRSLGERARHILAARGVDVRLNAAVSGFDADDVRLDDGSSVPGVPVWAGGFEAVMDELGPTDDGRLSLEVDGRVQGFEAVFAAGDAAAHIDPDGQISPMSAQIAVQAAQQVARNIRRLSSGQPTSPLRLRDRGWVVDLGGGVGVAELFGVPLAAPAVDRLPPVIHTAIDLRNLWQLGGIDAVRRLHPGARRSLDVGILCRAAGAVA